MSGLGITAIFAVGVWLCVLSVVMVLIVRQIALVMARLDHAVAFGPSTRLSLDNEGPKIGSLIDETVMRWVPELRAPKAHLLLLSATCSPCRQFAADLKREHLPLDRPVVVLVPGREELADAMELILPTQATIVRNPNATDIAQLLGMQMVPSAITFSNGVVTAKIVTLHTVEQFQQFVESPDVSATSNGGVALAVKGAEHGR